MALAEDLQDRLDRALKEALGDGAALPGRPVVARNRHLTLRFVGQCADEQVRGLREAIAARDLGTRFDARLGRLGAFPRAARARVLWVGTEQGTDELARLASEVEAATVAAGFAPEERPFQAHMTLSRLPDPADIRGLVDRIPSLEIPFVVDRVVLFDSHLTNGPPTYEDIATFELGPMPGQHDTHGASGAHELHSDQVPGAGGPA